MSDSRSYGSAIAQYEAAVTLEEILGACAHFEWEILHRERRAPKWIPSANQLIDWLISAEAALSDMQSGSSHYLVQEMAEAMVDCDGERQCIRSVLERTHQVWLQSHASPHDRHPFLWLIEEYAEDTQPQWQATQDDIPSEPSSQRTTLPEAAANPDYATEASSTREDVQANSRNTQSAPLRGPPTPSVACKYFLDAAMLEEILEACIFFVWKVERGRKFCPPGMAPTAESFIKWCNSNDKTLQRPSWYLENQSTREMVDSLFARNRSDASNVIRRVLERHHRLWLRRDGTRPGTHPIVWLYREFTFDKVVQLVEVRWEHLRSAELQISTPEYLATIFVTLLPKSAQNSAGEHFLNSLTKASATRNFAWHALKRLFLFYRDNAEIPLQVRDWSRSVLTRAFETKEVSAPRRRKGEARFIRDLDIFNLVQNAAHEFGLSATRYKEKSSSASSLGGSACDVVAKGTGLSVSRVSNICDEIRKSPVMPYHRDYVFPIENSKRPHDN